jgi:hypothetical protein
MIKIIVPALLLLGSACSHQQVQSTSLESKPRKLSHAALGEGIFSWASEEREPASQRRIPGADEFLKAVRANQSYFNVPVGYEVVKVIKGVNEEGERYENRVTSVYLKQNSSGYFSLVQWEIDGRRHEPELKIERNENYEYLAKYVVDQVEEIKRLSGTTFKLVYMINDESVCAVIVDASNPKIAFGTSETQCEDKNGAVLWEAKILSLKPVDLKFYKDTLKSVEAEASSEVLLAEKCIGKRGCRTKLREEESDWSHLVD